MHHCVVGFRFFLILLKVVKFSAAYRSKGKTQVSNLFAHSFSPGDAYLLPKPVFWSLQGVPFNYVHAEQYEGNVNGHY